VFCSFHWKGISFPSLKLLLGIFFPRVL
jgi:hypothetical protein